MQNNNTLAVFNNSEFSVRTIQDEKGIWFVAKDVAQALDYSETSNPARLFSAVPEIWAGVKRIHTRSENGVEQEREMLCLTEQGLYFFLGRSDKPKALPYQMWIAGDVVPSIKKHGIYATPNKVEEILNDPDVFIKVLQELKAEREKNQHLKEAVNSQAKQIDEMKPKALFAEAVETSKQSILIGDLAKILKQNGVNIGPNKLFQFLRDNDFLMKCKTASYNMPTQKSMNLGLFEIKERTINNPDGTVRLTRTTKVTGKGQIYFIDGFICGRFLI